MKNIVLLAFVLVNVSLFGAAATYGYGSYMGDGTSSKSITGVGFTPEAVFVKPVGAYSAWIHTNTMAAGYAKVLSTAVAIETGYINTIDAGGFTIGASANVDGVMYQYVVFDESSDFNIGSYTGDGGWTAHGGLTSSTCDVVWMFPAGAFSSTFTANNRFPKDGVWADGSDLGSQNAVWTLDGTGFTSGTLRKTNAEVYHFIAMSTSSDANTAEYGYNGDGSDNKSITPMGGGFTPDVVFTSSPAGNGAASFRTASMATNNSYSVAAVTVAADRIKTFVAGGVTLGTSASVNTNYGGSYSSILGFSGGTSLPVQLTSFTARKKGTDVELNWESSSEINSDYYEVLHSDDGIDYTSLGKVLAAGNSNHWLNYHFVHEAPGGGVHYYQLVEVDNDGATEKFKTLALTMNEQLEIITQMFPNPTRSTVSLYFNSATGGKYDIAVCDVSGKEYYKAMVLSMVGENLFKLSLADYPEGTYFVNLKPVNGLVSSIKVSKVD